MISKRQSGKIKVPPGNVKAKGNEKKTAHEKTDTAFGAKKGSQAERINNAIIATLKKREKIDRDALTKATELNKWRVAAHLKYLVERGHIKESDLSE